MTRIVVSGMGIVSALGVGKAETLKALFSEKSAISPIRYLNTIHRDIPAGEVPLSDHEIKKLINYQSDKEISRSALLGRIALEEAIAEAGLTPADGHRTAFLSGNTVGGMEQSEGFFSDLLSDESKKGFIRLHVSGSCTDAIAEAYGGSFKLVTTISTACSSAANAIIVGANLIRNGKADIVVAGGTECLSKFHFNGFNSLMILDHDTCKPFDAARCGLNLGEGAAYLVLESESSAKRRQAPILCELSGYGNACDAFHQTATSNDGTGPFLAMRQALESSGLKPDDIDYVNAHGTGTPNNDESESIAMQRIFGDKMPLFSSTKSFTGHTTSAAGSIESVISILALQHQFVPANINFSQRMDNITAEPVKHTVTDVKLHHVLSNSFGFGGNDSSCIFSLYDENRHIRLQENKEKKKVFIRAASQISIQEPLSEKWLSEALPPTQRSMKPQEADYSSLFAPMAARRMGNLFKRAIATSEDALQKAHLEQVDAIVCGTGLGCIDLSLKFLLEMIDNDEQCLPPTAFMQSTPNTIAAQIAIRKSCHGYNCTYSHGGSSFEAALNDALMQLQQNQISSALVGGHEEMNDTYFQLLDNIGFWKKGDINEDILHRHADNGSFSAYGSMSMVLSNEKDDNSLCRISGSEILENPTSQELESTLQHLLQDNGLSLDDLSAVVMGLNGDNDNDEQYLDFARQHCPKLPIVWYKQLFGESFSASAFGVYTAANLLKNKKIPTHLLYHTKEEILEPKHLIVYHHFHGKEHSLILLSLCGC